ncbi:MULTISPECIES: stalk domain-containing protein [unclassified Paenibacillus]|uniref:stalk domain-containing protein n=1 Tax=unclassified Paenibacillus TaxID=185978 RepID=UPI0008BB99F4|nr:MULTISPECIES: stalk domain-containing protein [unclassified Paenibacillus]SEK75915.1 Copper amine oxidase N-terminal domain-containing protein [Paenibacillus sp. OK003]SLK20096.1 Copper amine oxidase N-terminal domain-containing protein [Paenibacillus sp. RU5A]SOC76059.1 Copper amine oxidase N-terminal domain-containing protein [Paenibacillus sp. RU26A]SOC77777.1 Copper amine oxidase N-terminal domain-containing protein [Paenibacillus sp. RU5M]
MKRLVSLFLMSTLVVGVVSVASATDQPLKDLPFKERAAYTYNPSLKKIELNITKDHKLTRTTYNSTYVPMKDVFKQSGATFNWDGKKKITTVKNQGQELILNFSGKEITAGKNQVVLPREWVQLKNGVSSIDAFVLAYIFEVAADESDQERVDWEEKLKFLDIKETTGLPGLDKYMHVFVEFND